MIFLSLLLIAQAHAADDTLSKARFLDGMKAGMPASFCADKTYFRECFSISKDDCTKAVTAAVSACADKLQGEVPAQLHQPADGQKWGEKLGNCAGVKFEEEKSTLKLKKPECSDETKWKAP